MNTLQKKLASLSVVTALTFGSASTFADDEAAELLQLKRTQFTAEKALEKVSEKYKGQILEIELDDKNDQLVYEVEVVDLDKEKVFELYVNPSNGEVALSETESLTLLGFNRFDEDKLAALQSMKDNSFSLIGQLAKVKTEYPGVIKEAEFKQSKGVSYYKVKVLTHDGKRQKVILDAATGDMIPVMDHD